MKPRLYLETTIPSYLVSRRTRDLRLAADQETTEQWWESERHDYDAAHIGLAAAHGMDFLLTWNCRHINNHHIRARIERACEAVGLVCPDICTPAELMKL
jgi:hypothetical protein